MAYNQGKRIWETSWELAAAYPSHRECSIAEATTPDVIVDEIQRDAKVLEDLNKGTGGRVQLKLIDVSRVREGVSVIFEKDGIIHAALHSYHCFPAAVDPRK